MKYYSDSKLLRRNIILKNNKNAGNSFDSNGNANQPFDRFGPYIFVLQAACLQKLGGDFFLIFRKETLRIFWGYPKDPTILKILRSF